MPVTVCWAVKGGSGTTVVAATLALSHPAHSLLVDLDGELPAVLGLPEPSGQGVADWLGSDAPPDALDDLAVFVDRTTRLIPRGSGPVDLRATRWGELGEWLTAHPAAFVDTGTHPPPLDLLDGDVRSLLVTRACYLALRRAVTAPCRPDGVVLVHEAGRALRAPDVARAVGAPVVASVSIDPAVARAVDAGLLSTRLPRLLTRELRRATRADGRPAIDIANASSQEMTA
ncbi:MAG: hypothetical protein ABW195_14855 [Ilumatobacteraceae bacterium]